MVGVTDRAMPRHTMRVVPRSRRSSDRSDKIGANNSVHHKSSLGGLSSRFHILPYLHHLFTQIMSPRNPVHQLWPSVFKLFISVLTSHLQREDNHP